MSKSGAPGYEPGTTLTYNEENHYDVGSSDKQTYLQNFFNDQVGEGIPRNLRTHLDHMNSIYTSSNRIFMESPRIIADEINPYVYTGSSALIQGKGTYYGWVLSDCVSSATAEPVWRSNFPDDLEYCTVTVRRATRVAPLPRPTRPMRCSRDVSSTSPGRKSPGRPSANSRGAALPPRGTLPQGCPRGFMRLPYSHNGMNGANEEGR